MKTIYSAICPCCNAVCLSTRPLKLLESGERLDIDRPDMYGTRSLVSPSVPNPAAEQWLIEYAPPSTERTPRRRRSK
jgi:hypothetical protein